MFRLLAAIVIGLAWGSAAAGDPLALSGDVNRSQVTVGDPVEYRLSVEWDPTAIAVEEPVFPDSFGAFEKVDGPKVQEPSASRPSLRKKLWTVTMAAFETGRQTIPAIPLKYKLATGEVRQAEFPAIEVTVVSALDPGKKPGEIFSLKPPMEIAPDPKYRRNLIALIVAVILLGVLLAWAWKRRRKGPLAAPMAAVDDRSAEQVAYDALDALAGRRPDDIKQHFTMLGDILRAYLGRKFDFPAMDLTTVEIVEHLSRGSLAREIVRRIEGALLEADMVKFAKADPGAARAMEAVPEVRALVRDVAASVEHGTEVQQP